MWLVVLALPFAAAPTSPDGSRRAALVFAATISGCYVVGVVANMIAAALTGSAFGRDSFIVGFSNPRFPAQLQALTLPLLALALNATQHRGARAGVAVIFALWWMCAIGSGSRAAWLALLCAAVVMLWLGPAGWRWLKIQAVFAAIGAALYVGVFFVLAPALQLQVEIEQGRIMYGESVNARIELAKIALSMIRESPWLGVGPMHFAYVDNGLGAHPHNVWLQLAAEWGLPATAILAGLAATLFLRTLRAARGAAREHDGLLKASIAASLVALMVGSLFDGYFVVPTSQAAAAIVLSLAVAVAYPAATQQPMPVTRRFEIDPLLAMLVAPALVMLVVLANHPFGQATEREALWRAEHPTDAFWPRFWQQGWIGPDADPTAR